MEIFDYNLLSNEELCGQLLCIDITMHDGDDEAIKKIIRENHPGGLFAHSMSPEKLREYTEYAKQYCKYPLLIAADVEYGPGAAQPYLEKLPNPMAWGACNDEALIERAGELTAQIVRRYGYNFTFSPVVDINMNRNNPVINIRAISDDAAPVARITSAYMRGLQKSGLLVATAKHFPGDGVDDRNQHFCTTINPLSKDEWMNTFGKVYKRLIDDGVACVMAAHVSLPSYDEARDELGMAYPSIFSKTLMNDLLRKELGFDGCIISDAMSMIGAASVVPLNKMASTFINAGGDMILFPEKRELQYLLSDLEDGTLLRERVLDAVSRIIELKKKARLFEDEQTVLSEIEEDAEEKIREVSRKIAEGSVKVVRNLNGVLPLKLKKGDRILLVNLYLDRPGMDPNVNSELFAMKEALEERGFNVDVLHNPKHSKLNPIIDSYAAIYVNSKVSGTDFTGAGLRIGWEEGIRAFWRGYILRHPNLVFTSFGDPYKLYEFPYLRTYINAHSYAEASQRAVVALTLGEIEETAKNPVTLEGFFEREI